MLISPSYTRENEVLHSLPGYGSSGHLWLGHILEIAEAMGAKTLIDYGAGKGTLGKYVEHWGLRYTPYDPATFPKRPKKAADLLVCLDVLEHIEPDCLDDVLADMFDLTGRAMFCVVSTRASSKVLNDGRNSHLIQETWPWWKTKLHDGGLWRGVRTREHADSFDYVGQRMHPKRGLSKFEMDTVRGKT